nr:ankyrin repeat domain-containing protein [Bacillus niameyensis]
MEQRLISAATEGDIETILKLLEDGADINATDHHGDTAVMAATQRNNVDTVKILIEQGADINIRNKNQDNVLLYAGAEGLLEIVKLAIEAGADTTLTNRFGGTALIPASDRGHVDVVEELLTNSDTDVNHINNLHWTALLEAVILGDGGENYQKIVQLLVDHGADVNISDRDGVTPLEHAVNRGFKAIERILREART